MENRKVLSQNFLRKSELIDYLVELSSIKPTDHVVEIGGGKGAITEGLAKKAKQVTVFEVDSNFVAMLKERFQEHKHVYVREADFLTSKLPPVPYKVFSNIPFNLTTEIVGRLTHYGRAPLDTYLIVQQEYFERILPNSGSNLYSLLLKPFFDVSLLYRFSPNDFTPAPSVTCVMIRIKKKDQPDIDPRFTDKYRDFLTFFFNSKADDITNSLKRIFSFEQIKRLSKEIGFTVHQKPTTLTYDKWLALYEYFELGVSKEKQREIKLSYNKLQNQQKKMTKMKQTRHH